MASIMENLIEVLCQESDEYEGLLTLSQEKTRIIASADLEKLQKITDDEQEVVSRIARLEKRRTEVTADMANVLNKDVENFKLSNLIEMMASRPAEQAKLARVHDRLQNSVRELRRTNEQNKELLENALEMVEFEMNLLQAAKGAPEPANYTRDAYNSGMQIGAVSGSFDAKQ